MTLITERFTLEVVCKCNRFYQQDKTYNDIVDIVRKGCDLCKNRNISIKILNVEEIVK